MIRVLIVDDSAVARHYLSEVLDAAPGIRVVGYATNGEEAIEAVRRHKPDLVTMDITMPRMDGPTAIRNIMETQPTPIIVVTGNEITEEVRATFRSLESGALALIPRPHGPSHPDYSAQAEHLVQTVRLMSEVKVVRRWNRTPSASSTAPTTLEVPRAMAPARVVLIGASTGGPSAMKEIFAALPPAFPVPVVVVQHIASGFVEGFSMWLSDVAGRPVLQARLGERLSPNTVYVAPEHMQLGFSSLGALWPQPPRAGDAFCPSVSFTFKAAARAFGSSAVGVLLTGMGRDGSDGLLALRQAGALTIAQDEASSIVFGMPAEAIRLRAAELVLPPERIASTLAALPFATP